MKKSSNFKMIQNCSVCLSVLKDTKPKCDFTLRSSGFFSNHRFIIIAAELFRMVQGSHLSGNLDD